MTLSTQSLETAKYERILDLIQRAVANGTASEVAAAIARDWFPLCRIATDGKISFIIGSDGEKT